MLTVEQVINAQKTQVETLFGLNGLVFDGVEKLVELNLQAARSAMADAAESTQALLPQVVFGRRNEDVRVVEIFTQ